MPSFSIEVPGEANPLTENLLVNSLTSASSSDPNQVQTGTKQLQQWEKGPEYYKHLQSAYLDQRLPLEIRYLAIIQLKNGIDKYWRKTALNAVSKEDKVVIRSRLIDSALQEPDQRLAVQNALVIAKVARFEYPNDWPDLLSTLSRILRTSHLPPLQRARALLVLLHIVKELSTGRLQRSRQNLQAATPEVVHVLAETYASAVQAWRNNASEDDAISMQQSLLSLKVLRRLLISGFEHPNRDAEVSMLWGLTQQHLGDFIQIAKSAPPHAGMIEKHMVQLAKLHHEMARDHPAAFALLPNSVQLVNAYWSLAKEFGEEFGSKDGVASAIASAQIGTDGDVEERQATMEKLALKALLVIRACVKMIHSPSQTFKHRSPEDKEEKSRATDLVRNGVLTPQFAQDVMGVLVTKFFVFRASDLREWEEEPEEWEKREEGDGEDWEFSVRSCSEKLFLDLAINYKDILVHPLLQVFYSVATPQNEDVLFKDSVYTAIGLAAPVLHEHLDFDAFIRDVLAQEVQKPTTGFNIIRRRTAILLGQWISVKVSGPSRPLVFEIFQHLLNKDDSLNDQVVRVTAGRQFQKVCEDWEFKAEQFMPYAETILTLLMNLVEEVELAETKMALLNSISTAVENLAHHVTPFAERIVSMLSPLWAASGEEHLMKQAILTMLARLVNAMKADSLPLHPMVFPIIRTAVEPGSETEVYLLDDSMDLWASILVQTPEPASPDLLELIPNLYPIYQLGSENLRKALEITESYVLLAPSHVLRQEVCLPLLGVLTSLLGTLRPDANGMVCNLVELVIRAAENLGGETTIQQICEVLDTTGFLAKLLDGLRGSWIAHCTTGPLRKEPTVDGVVETDYFAILARLIMASTSGTLTAINQTAPAISEMNSTPTLEATMKWLLEEWFSHFENFGDPSRKKLMCLALTKLLETKQPFVLINLQSLMTIWTDVITELREDAADSTGDSLVYANGYTNQPLHDGPEAPEEARRRELSSRDVVHTIQLPQFVKSYLEGAVQACGGWEAFRAEWVVNVDQDVLKAFSELGIM